MASDKNAEASQKKFVYETLSNALDAIADKILHGRQRIFTDIKPDSVENIEKIIAEALPIHEKNANDMKTLIYYYLGIQNIMLTMSQSVGGADNKVILNYPQSITRDIVGYTYGEDIEFIQKDLKDIDKVNELKSLYSEDDTFLEDQITATYSSICGIAYECVLASDDYMDNPDVPFKAGHLNPLYTFAVQSYDLKNPVVLTATYYENKDGERVTTIYTDKEKYLLKNDKLEYIDKHGLTHNPITMFENNHFLLGDFETAIPIFDAINTVSSESINDIQNFVQSILVFINASLGDTEQERAETRKNIKSNRMIEIKAPENMTADAKYIAQQLNPQATSTIREYLEEALWKVVGIPDRKTRSSGGGDTGDAVELRDGWADLEVVARNKERFFKKAKRQQLKNILELLEYVDKGTKGLKSKDININFRRNKRDNLQSKSQSFSTLIATGVLDPVDALDMANLTTNVNEVIERGKKYQKEIQGEQNGDTSKEQQVQGGNQVSSMQQTIDEDNA